LRKLLYVKYDLNYRNLDYLKITYPISVSFSERFAGIEFILFLLNIVSVLTMLNPDHC